MEVFKIERENMITVKRLEHCKETPIKVSELKVGTTFQASWNGSKPKLFVVASDAASYPKTITYCLETEHNWGEPFVGHQRGDSNYYKNIKLVDIEICVRPKP